MSDSDDRRQFIEAELASARARWRAGDFQMDEESRSYQAYMRGAESMAQRLWDRKRAREKARSRRTRSLETLLEEPADPKDLVGQVDDRELIEHLLAILTEHERTIMRLSVQMSRREAAVELRTTEQGVKSTLERARARIRGTFPM